LKNQFFCEALKKFNSDLKLPKEVVERVRVRSQGSHEDDDLVDDFVSGFWVTPSKYDHKKVILYLHGGGFVIGSVPMYEPAIHNLAELTNSKIFFVDYPLAPEHQFPAGLKNIVAAFRYLVEQKGIDPNTIFITGDSAGGNLAITSTLAILENDLPSPKGVICFSPWTNLLNNFPSLQHNALTDPIASDILLENFARYYVGSLGRAGKKNYLVSPVFAPDLSTFPPSLLFVTDERLEDDSRKMVDRLIANGRSSELYFRPGLLHVWPALTSLPESVAALQKMKRWMEIL